MSNLEEIYRVVINAELQYSVWPDWKQTPQGWNDEGTKGTKQECLDHIDNVWTDMRPLSLRNFMEQFESKDNAPKVNVPIETDNVDHFHKPQEPNGLIKSLLEPQDVEIIRYLTDGKPDRKKLERAVENGYILVKFINTKGGTELGCNTKNDDSVNRCVINEQEKSIDIKGRLKLDYTPVRLNATINLETFKGKGHLEVINNWTK